MKNEQSVVYGHFNDLNECFYIGSCYLNKSKRYNSKHGRNYLWHKHAKNGFSVKILATCQTRKEAYKLEKEFIVKMNKTVNLFGKGYYSVEDALDCEYYNQKKPSLELADIKRSYLTKKNKPLVLSKQRESIIKSNKKFIIENGYFLPDIARYLFTESELIIHNNNLIKNEIRKQTRENWQANSETQKKANNIYDKCN